MRIVHISDLHVTSPYFVKDWGDIVVEKVNEISPELLIITGDLTQDGHPHEMDIAKRYVDRIDVGEKLIVPGNHDARNLGYEIFEEVFGTRYPFYEDGEVAVFGVDSTVPDIDDGHIGREYYEIIQERLSSDAKLRILALHHHLIPIPGTGRERQIPVDSGDVLKLIRELDLDLVLSGHKHLPWVWKLENTHFITAGTSTSRRLKGRSHPSFNVLEVYEGKVGIDQIDVDSGQSKKVLQI
ncbi:MAG: metallophosphoesterase [Methanomassiliicoccales archaeon]|nr:metallophosphoesterase [Methanomassiliicoccales archaeon]NYT15084.1 metallophosphoesterase [Methanomassiliicoccales archaeon]